MLRVVNSPAYNLANKISSIQQAVMLLGLDAVINIINGLMIRVAFEKFDTDNLVEFWALNEEMAHCCALLARRLGVADHEQAYLLGLFHNCGIPALFKKFPTYLQALQQGFEQSEVSVMAYVESEFRTSHTSIGYLIARNWKLPEPVSEAIRDHRDLDRLEHRSSETDGLLICLKIAEELCEEPRRLCGATGNAHWPVVSDAIFAELCIGEEDFEELRFEIQEQLVAI